MERLFKTAQFLFWVFTFSTQIGKSRKSYTLPILGFAPIDEATSE
jgi:hypothetical protein